MARVEVWDTVCVTHACYVDLQLVRGFCCIDSTDLGG